MTSHAQLGNATGGHAARAFAGRGPAVPGTEPTGPSAADRRCQHTGAFFASADELRDLVVPWLRYGLSRGDHVVAALPDEHVAVVRTALTAEERAAVDFTAYRDFRSAPGRTMALLHRLTVLHPGGVTIAWEPETPLHDPLALREWRRFDEILDSALARDPVRIMCVYGSAALPASERAAIVHSHRAFAAPHQGKWAAYLGAVPAAVRPQPHRGPLPEPRPPIRRLSADPDLPALRDRVIDAAAEFELPRDRVGDLVTAVNELAANALEHGAGTGTIALWRSPGGDRVPPRLVCDVFDTGGGLTDPFSGYLPTGALSVRGYGLWITRQVSDFMEVRGGPSGSLVRLHFTL